ncbi:MAG TPA: TIGR02147 family protein [Myxococcota bacterium]|nr:TIGR02147 family protein [Myxococcota bacterium]
MSPPDLFAFLDYRAFLAAWFEARKQANPRFSHRMFARMADQKSPSLLLQVVQRKRNLTEPVARSFAEAMKLDAEETTFFLALVDLDQAQTDEARTDAWTRISAERRFRAARRIEGQAWTYLSSTRLPALRELASLPGFREDPRWIGDAMRPKLTPAEARQGLETLESLGLLVRDSGGQLRPADVSVVTAREVGTLAVHKYHRDACDRARDAVSNVASAERHFLGLTVAIPPELMGVLKQELNGVQARLLDLCDANPGLKRRVVQINLHLFPLSEDV